MNQELLNKYKDNPIELIAKAYGMELNNTNTMILNTIVKVCNQSKVKIYKENGVGVN